LITGVLAVMLAMTWAVFAPTGLPKAVAACTIPASSISVTALDTSSGSNSSVSAWDQFKFTVELTNLDGLAAGCTASVTLPSMFGSMQDTTLYLNADGSASVTEHADSMAMMQIDANARTVTFTLTDYASTHTQVTATGWLTAQIDSSIVRGVTEPLTVTINGTAVTIGTITPVTCTTDCPTAPSSSSKWGERFSDGTGSVTIQSPVAAAAGTAITVVDTLTNAGQSITGVGWTSGYDCVNTWGDPGVLQPGGGCDTSKGLETTYTGTPGNLTIVTTVPNEFVSVNLTMRFVGSGPWTDSAKVTVAGQAYDATAVVTKYAAGGGGSGTTPSVVVGDYVWLDSNRDGIQDASETGIEEAVVTLTGPDGRPVTDINGAPVGPATTDATGHYFFTDLPVLPPGQAYTVRIDNTQAALSGLVPTTP